MQHVKQGYEFPTKGVKGEEEKRNGQRERRGGIEGREIWTQNCSLEISVVQLV